MVLVRALSQMRALTDVINICRSALTKFPNEAGFDTQLAFAHEDLETVSAHLKQQGVKNKDRQAQLSSGGVRMRLYPWTPKEYRTRNQGQIDAARAELKRCSTKLQIQPSILAGSSAHTNKSACLGMFAKKNILPGDVVLSAPALISASNKPFAIRCYNCHADLSLASSFSLSCCPSLRFCSLECRDISESYYHKALCGRDYKEALMTSEASKAGTDSGAVKELVFLRILALCIQAEGHPLQHPMIARLVPQYNPETVIPWRLRDFIISPIEILQSLGVDIFAASQYDTWVLQTIWYISCLLRDIMQALIKYI
jgi:hypothetical protein